MSTIGDRVPRQRRGAETKERLLVAASELLAERGVGGFRLTEVSDRAGVAYGAVYWYFAHREALLRAVHERLIGELDAYALELRDPERWSGASLPDVVGGVVDVLGRIYAHNPPLLRAMALHGGADPAVLERASGPVRRLGDDVAALLGPHLELAGHPEPQAAAEELFVTVVSVLAARVTWPVFFDRPAVSWDRLVSRLRQMALADIAHAVEAARPHRRRGSGRQPPPS